MAPSITVNGKEYISSREARRLSNYTSDYIGQMARDGRVDSIKRGKGRYVLKDAFLVYANSQGKLKKGVYAPTPSFPSPGISEEASRLVTYEEETADLFPVLRPKEVKEIHNGSHRETVSDRPVHESTLEPLSAPAPSEIHSARAPLLTSIMIPIISVVLVVASYFVFSVSGDYGESNQTHSAAVSLALDAKAFLEETVNLIGGFLLGIGGTMRGISDARSEGGLVEATATPSNPEHLVVFPSRDFSEDEEKVQHIKDSFSDEVKVMRDGSGTGGYIVPVFREETDERYRYIIVPES